MVMKPIVYLFLMFFSGLAQARFGVGAQLGFPTGVTAKNWVKSAEAIDATLAWDLGPGNNFLLQSSYLWHKKDYLFFQDKEPLDLYFGLGGRMKFADEIHLGVRAPVAWRTTRRKNRSSSSARSLRSSTCCPTPTGSCSWPSACASTSTSLLG